MHSCIFISFTIFLGIETFGKNAVVCGRSKNVGMPIAMLLHSDGIGETKAGKHSHLVFNPYAAGGYLGQYKMMQKT